MKGLRKYVGATKTTYNWKYQHNGTIHTGTFATDSEREANELFTLKKAEIRRGIKAEPKPENDILLSTFIDEYLPKRRKGKDDHVIAAVKEFFAGKGLKEIQAPDCKRFRQWRLSTPVLPKKEGGKTRERSPRTVNREFSVLSSIFTRAVEEEFLSANPCHGIPSLEFVAHQPQIWTREQASRAVEWMIGEREHLLPLVLVTLQTGLSRKDLFQLRAGQVQIDGDYGVIRKPRAKTGVPINVPLNSVAIEILKPLVKGKRSNAYVFVNRQTGKPYRDIRKSLDTACRLAGVPRVTWHKLRHCVGTWLAEDGAGIEVIARFLSHSGYRTAQVYVQLAAEKVRPQAERLGAWVRKGKEEKKTVKKTAKVIYPKLKLVV